MNKLKGQILCLALVILTGYSYSSNLLDQTFAEAGKLQIDIGPLDYGSKILISDDGSIFILGNTAKINPHNQDAIIVKVQSDGTLDSNYGVEGILRFDFPGQYNSRIIDAVIDNDWLYFIGEANPNALLDSITIFVGKIDLSGNFDPLFGKDGYYSEQYSTHQTQASSVRIDNNKIVFAGTLVDTVGLHTEYPLIGRLLTDGTRDTTFGGTGVITWSSYTGLQDAFTIPTSINRHSDGAQLTDLLIMNDQYYASGFYYVGETLLGYTLMLNKDGSAADYGTHNGAFIMDLSPGYNSFIVNAYLDTDTISLVGQLEDEFGIDKFFVKRLKTSGLYLDEETYDFNGNINQIKSSTRNKNAVYIAGLSKDQSNSTAGYYSDGFAICKIDNDLSLTNTFAEAGYYIESFSSDGNESGTYSIEANDSSIVAVGYVEVSADSNYVDIGVMKLIDDASLKTVIKDQLSGKSLLYPNPASNTNVIIPTNDDNIKIYDAIGRIVYVKIQHNSSGYMFNSMELTNGIFYLYYDSSIHKLVVTNN